MKKFICILIVLLSVSPSFASVLRYRVRKGDTLPAIARYYYGDEKKDLYIIMLNHLNPHKSLKTGSTILIPFVTVLRVRKRETFKNLAALYLKDPQKAGALAILNGMDAGKVLKQGTVVKIPFALFYRVKRGDTLDKIAAKYLGDQKDAVFLKDYNRLKTLGDIKPGMIISLPIMVERARHIKHTIPRAKKEKINTSLYSTALHDAVALYDRGDYTSSIDKLIGITLKVPADKIVRKDLITLHEYKAFDYIAMDETVAAKGEFMEILKLDPGFSMDPRTTSPKILSVFDEVKHARR
ncbi:MAG: LysM peptidoglycan-binding domain-containing protein [Deltaproteobacteria bacterium]|nr:LysM peptidoglycan-binding domain-containing protein [Deltaproteobacteria bacterium]